MKNRQTTQALPGPPADSVGRPGAGRVEAPQGSDNGPPPQHENAPTPDRRSTFPGPRKAGEQDGYQTGANLRRRKHGELRCASADLLALRRRAAASAAAAS